jgi:DNA-binding CsgD family transcriptional regulator/HD-like signal output (HDOD) protein
MSAIPCESRGETEDMLEAAQYTGGSQIVDDPPAVVGGNAPRGLTRGIGRVMRHVQDLPAFKPACDHALAALDATRPQLPGLIAAIESDTGLTVAVLRRAQRLPTRRAIADIPEAVAKLRADDLRAVIDAVPRASFPWRTAQEALIQDLRLHGQTVALAADCLAEEVSFGDRDELVCAALLHDVGKVVFALAIGDVNWCADTRGATPEQRIRDERRLATLDHACLGSILAERWGLPERLTAAIGGHHRSDSEASLTSLLRLADIVAHCAVGDAVDRRIMLRLAAVLGVRGPALRDVLFDLPHTGSTRRRSMPSPLSDRETAALRELAAGKVYKDIAQDLGVATSTVRTHLHSVYAKLEVVDRAQAVLRASEMGWI